MHHKGLFGPMRIRESEIDHSSDTPSACGTPTMPSPAHTPPPIAAITEVDTDAADCSVHTVPVHLSQALTWSATCESIAQRLANHQTFFAIHSLSPFRPVRLLHFTLSVNAIVIYPSHLASDRRRLITSRDSTSHLIAGIPTLDLPTVCVGDIALWLRVVESCFTLRQVTRDDTKFHYVVTALAMDIATDLRVITDHPPTVLKKALMTRISLSTQKRLKRLISEEDLGDKNPTQLLRRLEQLAGGRSLDATMFKQLLAQKRSSSVQAVLAPNTPSSSFQMLTETADRIPKYYWSADAVRVASGITAAPASPTIENVIKLLDALAL
ncbi:hypothetical protein SprV_0100285700 [Sparganum proliferum]